jgi:quercetin dioxygenase-like cupin family protein
VVRTLTLSVTVFVGTAAMVASALGAFGPTLLAQQAAGTPFISTPDSTELLTMDHGTMRFLAEAKTTDGAVTVIESSMRSGYRTNAHRHPFPEYVYVMEGILTLEIEGVRHQVTPGGLGFIPPKTLHALGNDGQTPTRGLLMTSPAQTKLEAMFRQRDQELKKANPATK